MLLFQDGQTALHLAAYHVREDMVRLLLNRKADPAITENVRTPQKIKFDRSRYSSFLLHRLHVEISSADERALALTRTQLSSDRRRNRTLAVTTSSRGEERAAHARQGTYTQNFSCFWLSPRFSSDGNAGEIPTACVPETQALSLNQGQGRKRTP